MPYSSRMARSGGKDSMDEEGVTRAVVRFLKVEGWQIISCDLPQMGSGILLQEDRVRGEKNKGGIIPDIIAYRERLIFFCESKKKFAQSDVEKMESVKRGKYKEAIAEIFPFNSWNETLVSIGLAQKHLSGQESFGDLDIVFKVEGEGLNVDKLTDVARDYF